MMRFSRYVVTFLFLLLSVGILISCTAEDSTAPFATTEPTVTTSPETTLPETTAVPTQELPFREAVTVWGRSTNGDSATLIGDAAELTAYIKNKGFDRSNNPYDQEILRYTACYGNDFFISNSLILIEYTSSSISTSDIRVECVTRQGKQVNVEIFTRLPNMVLDAAGKYFIILPIEDILYGIKSENIRVEDTRQEIAYAFEDTYRSLGNMTLHQDTAAVQRIDSQKEAEAYLAQSGMTQNGEVSEAVSAYVREHFNSAQKDFSLWFLYFPNIPVTVSYEVIDFTRTGAQFAIRFHQFVPSRCGEETHSLFGIVKSDITIDEYEELSCSLAFDTVPATSDKLPSLLMPDYELFSQDGKAYMKITKDIVRDSSDNSLVVGPTFDSFDEMKQAFLQNGLTKQQLQELSRLVKDTKDPFAVVNLNRLYEPRLAGATKINSVEFLIDRYMLWISAESGSIGSAMLYVLPDTTFMTVEEFAQAVKNRSDNTVIGENRNISDRGAHEITYQTGISTCRQLSYTVEGEYAVYTVVETYRIDTTGTLPVNQKIPYKMQIYATGKDGICFSLDWMTLKDRPTVEEIAAIRLVEYAGNP